MISLFEVLDKIKMRKYPSGKTEGYFLFFLNRKIDLFSCEIKSI